MASPIVLIHLGAALGCVVLGAIILNLSKGDRRHRILGWSWVASMTVTAVSAASLRDHALPNIAGITPIHAFVLMVAIFLPRAVFAARRHDIASHRVGMKGLYIGACVVAGLLTLLPGRLLGNLLWSTLGRFLGH